MRRQLGPCKNLRRQHVLLLIVVVLYTEYYVSLPPTTRRTATTSTGSLSSTAFYDDDDWYNYNNYYYCNAASTSGSSSSVSTTSSLTNIRSLDEYGNAKQLQYAMNAANENGRFIAIVTNMPPVSSSSSSSSSNTMNSTGSAIWIISPITSKSVPPLNHRRRRGSSASNSPLQTSSSSSMTGISLLHPQTTTMTRPSSLIHPITTTTSHGSSSSSSSSLSYIIATGMIGDLRYLLQQLRLYCKYNWERYDNNFSIMIDDSRDSSSSNDRIERQRQILPPPKVTSVLQLILQQFWGYPTGVGNNNDDDDDDNDSSSSTGRVWIPMGYRQMLQQEQSSSWGRPFGLCGIVVQYNSIRRHYTITDEFNPTGIVVGTTATTMFPDHTMRQIVCLGPQHELIRDELMKVLQGSNSSSSSSSSNSTVGSDDDRTILEQMIITAIEHVTHTNKVDNMDNIGPNMTYQLEILNPPPIHRTTAISSNVTTTTTPTEHHVIRIIQRK